MTVMPVKNLLTDSVLFENVPVKNTDFDLKSQAGQESGDRGEAGVFALPMPPLFLCERLEDRSPQRGGECDTVPIFYILTSFSVPIFS